MIFLLWISNGLTTVHELRWLFITAGCAANLIVFFANNGVTFSNRCDGDDEKGETGYELRDEI